MTNQYRRARIVGVCVVGLAAGLWVEPLRSDTCPDNCGSYNCNPPQVLNWCPNEDGNFSNQENWDNDPSSGPGTYRCPDDPEDNDCCCAPPDTVDELVLRGAEPLVIDDAAHTVDSVTVWGATDTGVDLTIDAQNGLTLAKRIHLKHGGNTGDTVSLTVEGGSTVDADYIWHEGAGTITVTSGARLTTY